MNTEKLAEVLARFADAVNEIVDELQNDPGQDQGGHEVEFNEAPKVRVADGPDANALVQVPAGDLWKLVNRSRKMIRLAREGKVPSMETRAPLCRAIKAIKALGLAKKPYNLRD